MKNSGSRKRDYLAGGPPELNCGSARCGTTRKRGEESTQQAQGERRRDKLWGQKARLPCILYFTKNAGAATGAGNDAVKMASLTSSPG